MKALTFARLIVATTVTLLMFGSAAWGQMGLKPYDESLANRYYGLDKTPAKIGRVSCQYLDHCHQCVVREVVDGHTLKMNCGESILVRLAGVVSPRTGKEAECDRERVLAADAIRFLDEILGRNAQVEVIDLGKGLDDLTIALVRYNERDLASELIWHGHAQAARTSGNPISWCA